MKGVVGKALVVVQIGQVAWSVGTTLGAMMSDAAWRKPATQVRAQAPLSPSRSSSPRVEDDQPPLRVVRHREGARCIDARSRS